MTDNINEQVVLDRYEHYRSSMNIHEAVNNIVDDLLNEGCGDAEVISVITDVLVPTVAVQFAESYESGSKKYQPDDVFSCFCKFNHFSEELENGVANWINEASRDDCALKPEDWAELSDEARMNKVKLFLKTLASASKDFSHLNPFLNDLDVGKDSYGNDFSAEVKTFDRAAHSHGDSPDEEQADDEGNCLKTATIPTTNESVAAEDEDRHFANAHPLAKVLKNHGYGYSKTLRATAIKPVVTVTPHHIWVNHANHMVIAAEGDTKWRSKVSSHSGHSWEGVGVQSLDKHLSLKNKRYKKQLEQHSLPTTPLMENLLQGSDRVKKYADFISRNPFSSLGHQLENESLVKAQRDSLIESWRLREVSERKFGSSEANTDYRAASLYQLNERKKKNG